MPGASVLSNPYSLEPFQQPYHSCTVTIAVLETCIMLLLLLPAHTLPSYMNPAPRTQPIIMHSSQAARLIFRRSPAALGLPLVLLVLMISLGVWGTVRAARDAAQQNKQLALACEWQDRLALVIR